MSPKPKPKSADQLLKSNRLGLFAYMLTLPCYTSLSSRVLSRSLPTTRTRYSISKRLHWQIANTETQSLFMHHMTVARAHAWQCRPQGLLEQSLTIQAPSPVICFHAIVVMQRLAYVQYRTHTCSAAVLPSTYIWLLHNVMANLRGRQYASTCETAVIH